MLVKVEMLPGNCKNTLGEDTLGQSKGYQVSPEIEPRSKHSEPPLLANSAFCPFL